MIPAYIPNLEGEELAGGMRKLAEYLHAEGLVDPIWHVTLRPLSPWVEVKLDLWEETFAIWRATGAVHRVHMQDDGMHYAGAVHDDPFLTL